MGPEADGVSRAEKVEEERQIGRKPWNGSLAAHRQRRVGRWRDLGERSDLHPAAAPPDQEGWSFETDGGFQRVAPREGSDKLSLTRLTKTQSL